MEANFVSYIELYKLRAGLLKQINELDNLMEKIIPKDSETLSKLVNNITLGVYDFPFDGLLKEKILFSLKQLSVASEREIKRYMSIVGVTEATDDKFELELKKLLLILIKKKVITRIKFGNNLNDIKYKITE